MRKTAISIFLAAMMIVLYLASAGQSTAVSGEPAGVPDFVGVPSSYYLFGEIYEHPTNDDIFSKWYDYKKKISYMPVQAESFSQESPQGNVSTHLDTRTLFRDYKPETDNGSRGGNTILVSPTYTSISQVPPTVAARRAASLVTLDELQAAIDAAPNNTVIQLSAGYYDLSAVVNTGATASCQYNFYNGMVGPFCENFGPYSLVSQMGTAGAPAGYGLVVLDKKKLTIAGAIGANGIPQTFFLGNPVAITTNVNNAYQYNVALSIGGGSNQVTVTGIEFQNFAFPVRILDHYSMPTTSGLMFSSDPVFEGGSHKAEIGGNIFKQAITAVSIEGRHVLPFVENNMIMMGPNAGVKAAINVFGVPGKQLENPRILGNTISGFGGFTGVNVAWGFITNGWIKDNNFSGGAFGVQVLGSSGWQIKDNTFTGSLLSGVMLKSNVYAVPGQVFPEQFLQRSSENQVTGNTFQSVAGTAISLWGATLNTISNNQVQGAAIGLYFFVDINILGVVPPFDVHYVPSDFNNIESNSLAGCATPVLLANYARNNNLLNNSITLQGFGPGYILMGVLNTTESNVNLGRASGNYILDPDLATNPFLVTDLSFCNVINGITFCNQIDYDNDGLLNEDEINGLNDDGDLVFAFPGIPQYLFDEDASDDPNIYTATAAAKDLIAEETAEAGSEEQTSAMVCHPNPVETNSTVTVTLKEATHVTLNLYNEQGREVLNLDRQFRSAGTYQYEIVRRDLSAGMYVLQLITQSDVLTQKIILGR